MKIIVFCYEFPPIGGGAGRALLHLASSWVSLGHDTLVVTSHYAGLKTEEVVRGVRVKRLMVGRKSNSRGRVREMFKYMLYSLFKSGLLYKQERPDLAVAFMAVPCGLAPLWLNLRYKLPYAVELRGGDVPGFSPDILRFYHFFTTPLIKMIWNKSKVLIANSRGLADLAKKTAPIQKDIIVVPNGVDSKFHSPVDHADNLKAFTLLFVGRLVDKQKNITTLIRSLSNHADCRLVLVGDGPDRLVCEKLAMDLKLQNRISFAGWLSEGDLVEAYQNADIYVSASLWEGMPNTALEAMASGLPLVLSDIPSHREISCAGKNGLLFDANSVDALSARINELKMNKELRKSIGANGRAYAMSCHDWLKLSQKHLEAFS